jgi:hypothetical protein
MSRKKYRRQFRNKNPTSINVIPPKKFLNSGKTSKDRSIPEQKQNKVCFAGMRFGFINCPDNISWGSKNSLPLY